MDLLNFQRKFLIEVLSPFFQRFIVGLGHKTKTLKFYHYQVAYQREKYDEAKLELDKTLKVLLFIYVLIHAQQLVKKYAEKVSSTDPLRPYVDIIISKVTLEIIKYVDRDY